MGLAIFFPLWSERTNILMFHNLLVVLALVSAGYCNNITDHFVEDLITAYSMKAPTIVIYDDVPEYCRLPWVLCLMNNQEGDLSDLVYHLEKLYKGRKQDGLIILNFPTNTGLVNELGSKIPSIFSSNCPVFMPVEYDMVELRLDSNIIFFQEKSESFRLVDKFAVKRGAPISLVLGNWVPSNGIKFQKSMNRWERRTDLQGAILLSGLTRHDNKFSRWFRDKLSYITEYLNLTVSEMVILRRGWEQFENGSWGGAFGMVENEEVDVLSYGVGVGLHRSTVLEYTIQTSISPTTLIAQIPRGKTPDIWVYLRVFGITTWAIFLLLLVALVLAISIASNEVSINYLDSILAGLTLAYLY